MNGPATAPSSHPAPPLSIRAQAVEAAIHESLSLLAQTLQVQASAATTHRTLLVSGWNASAAVRQAIARYLVGLRVSAVNAALQVRAELTDTPTDQAEIVTNVEAIVGVNGAGLTQEQIERHRNPWIAEAIWHLCLALAQRMPHLHPPGNLVALNLPHAEATEHGLDVAAIYEIDGGFGLSIVETKAYPNRPSDAISHSAGFFRKVDQGLGNLPLKIRQTIQRMRADLPEAMQGRIKEFLWRQNRSYLPNPHYDDQNVVVWTNARPSLDGLFPGPGGIIIMPHAVTAFTEYFDAIATEMLVFARSL